MRDERLRHHLSVFFSGGVLTVSRIAAGFVRIKYVAFVLGTAGVGFMSQAGQMQLLGVSLASVAMAAGIINRMGVPGNDTPEGERRVLSTALTIQLAASAVFVIVALAGSGYFSGVVFPNESLLARTAFIAVTLSVPFGVVASGYVDAVLFGIFRYDLYVKASIATAVAGTATTILLIQRWGLAGAFWGMCAMSMFNCAFDVIALSRARSFREMFRFGFDMGEARALLKFCFVMLLTGAGGYLSRLWIQARVIDQIGVEANGLLHVPLAITSYYTPFLTNALWGRLHPAVTRTGDAPAGQHELAIALRLTVLVASTVIVTVLPLAAVLVRLAYSPAFLPATALLPVQLVGDLFYFVAVTFSVYILGVSRLRPYLFGWLIYYSALAAVSSALVHPLGLRAVPIGYAATSAVLGTTGLVWFARRNHGTDRWQTVLAIAGCFAVVGAQSTLAAWEIARPLQFILAAAMILVSARVFFAGKHALWDVRSLWGNVSSSP
jgi:O-antigen/teichoic acid export membrane protein